MISPTVRSPAEPSATITEASYQTRTITAGSRKIMPIEVVGIKAQARTCPTARRQTMTSWANRKARAASSRTTSSFAKAGITVGTMIVRKIVTVNPCNTPIMAEMSVAPWFKGPRTRASLMLGDAVGKVEEVAGTKSMNQIPMMMLTCQMTMIKARQECPNHSTPDLA